MDSLNIVLYIVAAILAVGSVALGIFLNRLKAQNNTLKRDNELQLTQVNSLKKDLEQLNKKLSSNIEASDVRIRKEWDKITEEKRRQTRTLSDISDRIKVLEKRESDLRKKESSIQSLVEKQQQELERVSGMTREEAIRNLTESLKETVDNEVAKVLEKRRQSIEERSEEEARRLISLAVHRYASPHTVEGTVSYVDVPSEEFKGKIIGREGRNIRVIERETGVDVVIDDTPGVITVSAFDGVRREIAKRSLDKLIKDGRIHPARIEEVVDKTKQELEREITKIGEKFLLEHELHNVHPKLVTLLGRLKYRTSYGQNVLQHISEVAHVSEVIASEMGLNPKLARRCGVFHDIGKAVDHTFEGSHPEIGGYLLKRFNEKDEVIEAAAHHHTDPTQVKFPYTIIVSAADAVSASRPGARGETGQGYIKRIERLEAIAKSFPGVINAYAVYAGRELRVIVDAGEVGDDKSIALAQELAKTIEDQLTYPGEIKVTLIREKRIVDYAR